MQVVQIDKKMKKKKDEEDEEVEMSDAEKEKAAEVRSKEDINHREEKLKEKWGQELARRQDRVVENQKAEAKYERIMTSFDRLKSVEDKNQIAKEIIARELDAKMQTDVEDGSKKDHDIMDDEHSRKEKSEKSEIFEQWMKQMEKTSCGGRIARTAQNETKFPAAEHSEDGVNEERAKDK